MMNTDFSVEIIGRETITPSCPTPPHLRHVRLSLLDQFMPEIYVPFVYFYSNHADHQCSILKTSLAETLTHFYPFAGEFQSDHTIICDDRGASFVEAKVNRTLSKVLDDPDANELQCLLPCPANPTQAFAGYLVRVQVNLFECGGMAIAISISHKIADGFTMSKFMNWWSAKSSLGQASNTAAGHHLLILPRFDITASLYPPQDFLNSSKDSKPTMELVHGEKCSTRRFLFDASRIAALKLKAASDFVPTPTRTEVVSALIWQCAMEASRENLGSIRPSSWRQAVNIRRGSGQ